MKFGDYLKRIRKRRKITQENLARSLEVSSVYIHQLETGKVDAPSFDRCQQISSILGVKVEEIWSVSRTERLKRFIEKEAISEQELEVLTNEEKMLLKLYRSLDGEIKKDFAGMVFMLLRHSQDKNLRKILEEFVKCA
ncbi:MAG: helix-turn-helix domain-containing protein [Candidatus Dadabacteria bacterium]|nr:helix-turn-helix domain-containing protein [Candidatus Dadabacteria bacterium]MDE0159555.1 helix-turn-helix domain-containing protein [Candidatus Dadabacteria bacterium]MDE0292254.1 helix-turn-helix domain-containing protein [Candidatus Dadabacteria bacterium]MDE0477348.1 helix-turn-helix domain-containing protein [Candidatus Dadabacteria bacterium]MXZ48436.1 helix-turn-helix domain-containing protein [Candidatus Dadabacteria bacterium]